MSYWADSAFLSDAGIPTVLYGPEGEGAHADVEWVSLSGTSTAATVLTGLARTFCSSARSESERPI
jgi:acetylornithine deacetylase